MVRMRFRIAIGVTQFVAITAAAAAQAGPTFRTIDRGLHSGYVRCLRIVSLDDPAPSNSGGADLLIADLGTWRQFWVEHESLFASSRPIPRINFRKNFVIVSVGKCGGLFSDEPEITTVERVGKRLRVEIAHSGSPNSGGGIPDYERGTPYHIVVARRPSRFISVAFEHSNRSPL